MAAEQFANLAATTLNGAINNAVTTVVVASGAAPFPSSAQFRIVVDSEIMLVTAGAGTASWTVTRGAESTTAASHADGAAVTHVLTAGALGVVSDPSAAVPGLRTLGSGATQAAGGTDSRLSDARTPTAHKTSHEPGGTDALTLLDNSSIKAAAGIVLSKLATDPLARANHTGTQTMSTISDAGTLATKSAIASADITDGTIVDADINGSAAIAATKVSGTAVTQADSGTVTSTMILDGTIVNADVNAAAAIVKTKISGTAITAADVGTVSSAMIARTNALSRTGALAETWHREQPGATLTTFAPTGGALYLIAIELPISLVIGHITFLSGTAAASGPTHQWFGLYNSARVQLATTTDDTSTAWGSNAEKTLAVSTIASGASSTFTTTYTGLHYLGIVQTASTSVAQLTVAQSNAAVNALAPIIIGTSNTSQTTPPAFAFTASAITATGNIPYAYVSA